ncbi:MAG: hypothetical protein AVDCRST_MAG19-4971 [uncultured Thermomicrobiales bacterium]|uniref:Uncharacterized protein n=1 Tax=uncultured Thermomicrobiales bacterium TaxID=1645740 RepID=A0A6J4VRR2_9BACT|nr:MAG: hypothetical protein AVDCRST_MAG19-4971 [uncultured Thermomicrobiales bacterium]
MVDQLLGGLFGAQDDDDDDRRRSRARDFVNRYETGRPEEGYSDEEAYQNFRQVAGRLSPQEFEESASETFGRLSPQERRQLKRQMRERGGGRIDLRDDDDDDDPRQLARAAARYRDQDEGGLASLFGFGGGGGGDLLSSSRGGGGGMLDNPLAKVAMGGIAAMAMKKMINR